MLTKTGSIQFSPRRTFALYDWMNKISSSLIIHDLPSSSWQTKICVLKCGQKEINSTLFCAVFLRRKNTELQVSGRCRQSDLSVLQWTAQSRLQFLTCKILKQSQCGVSQIFLQQPCWEILSLKRSKFGQPTKIVHDSCSYSGVMTPPEPALKMTNLKLVMCDQFGVMA